jgi:hypothetical protein
LATTIASANTGEPIEFILIILLLLYLIVYHFPFAFLVVVDAYPIVRRNPKKMIIDIFVRWSLFSHFLSLFFSSI